MSRSTGKFLLIENGQIGAEKYSEEIIEYMRNIPVQVLIDAKDFVYGLQRLKTLGPPTIEANFFGAGCRRVS